MMKFKKNTILELKNSVQELKKQNVSIFFLYGPIGIGKTQFVKFFLENYEVNSPTFGFYNEYGNNMHFDLYRADNNHLIDLKKIILENFLENKFIFIEWSEKLETNYIKLFSPQALNLYFSKDFIEIEKI